MIKFPTVNIEDYLIPKNLSFFESVKGNFQLKLQLEKNVYVGYSLQIQGFDFPLTANKL